MNFWRFGPIMIDIGTNDATFENTVSFRRKSHNSKSITFLKNSASLLTFSKGGREAKLETGGFLFGCVLYRMICRFQFVSRRYMGFCTAIAILDTVSRTKL